MLVHICRTCNWLPGSDWQRVLGRRRARRQFQMLVTRWVAGCGLGETGDLTGAARGEASG